MTHLSLFSGIGGMDLAAQWAGFTTIQFVEIDPFCQKVLAKNFPGVPIHGDVTTFAALPFRGRIDVLSGGFPCQGISGANPAGTGLSDPRSGLWQEMHRIICECLPRFVVAENVPNLKHRGIDRVLGDLESAGYRTETFLVSAESVGAPHRRERVFIVAHANNLPGLQADSTACAERGKRHARNHALRGDRAPAAGTYWQVHQPPISGVDDGIPYRMERNRALGNAVVPQQAYPFLAAIAERITGGIK